MENTADKKNVTNAIWVASYPKSGNTWMLLSLQAAQLGGFLDDLGLNNKKNSLAAGVQTFERFLDIEPGDLTQEEIVYWRPQIMDALAKSLTKSTFFKVHDQAFMADNRLLISKDSTRAIIQLVRDPRDVAISWSHHSNITLDQSIDFLCNEKAIVADSYTSGLNQLPQFLGSWSRNCESWMSLSDDVSYLQLRYEDRLENPKETLRQVFDFVDLKVSEEVLERTLKLTHFDNLKSMENRKEFSEKPAHMKNFFRQGKSGEWQKVLSDKQANRIETAHGKLMKKLGYL